MPFGANIDFVLEETKINEHPQYLYKILSLENWNKSKSQPSLVLSKEDQDFIHLSKQNQVDKIIDKYWSNDTEYVVLKLKVDQLLGNLIYEKNPNGTNEYYHLYNGTIPLNAVVNAEVIKLNR